MPRRPGCSRSAGPLSEADSLADPRLGRGRGSLRRVLGALCVTEIVSYGVVFYAFTVLLPRIAADTGWGQTSVTAAFSAGSLAGGLAGIVGGRVLQRRGPRVVMTAGSVLGTIGILGVAWSPSYLMFFAAWVIAGAASAGLFYPPAFAALTGWYGPRSVQAITTLTLAAGFSSTIFAPLTDLLASHLSWRATYVVLALVLAAVTLPAHLVVLDRPWPGAHRAAAGPTTPRDRHILTSRTFLLATTAGTLMAFASYASLVALVPLLTDRGMSSGGAAWALGLGGAGQVAGRVFYPRMTRNLDPRTRAVAVMALMAAGLAGLAAVPGAGALLVALAILAGAARGLFTLVGATLVSDYWGTERYAAISGVYNAPILVASALAPWLGAVIASATGSQTRLFLILAATAAAAAVLASRVPAPAARRGRGAQDVE